MSLISRKSFFSFLTLIIFLQIELSFAVQREERCRSKTLKVQEASQLNGQEVHRRLQIVATYWPALPTFTAQDFAALNASSDAALYLQDLNEASEEGKIFKIHAVWYPQKGPRQIVIWTSPSTIDGRIQVGVFERGGAVKSEETVSRLEEIRLGVSLAEFQAYWRKKPWSTIAYDRDFRDQLAVESARSFWRLNSNPDAHPALTNDDKNRYLFGDAARFAFTEERPGLKNRPEFYWIECLGLPFILMTSENESVQTIGVFDKEGRLLLKGTKKASAKTEFTFVSVVR